MRRREPLEAGVEAPDEVEEMDMPESVPDMPKGSEVLEITDTESPISAKGLESLAEVDRQGRIGRTTVQAGSSGFVVVFINYISAYMKLDLDPWEAGTQTDLPIAVAGSLFAAGAWFAARVMNRK